jgi:hypothetical protein
VSTNPHKIIECWRSKLRPNSRLSVVISQPDHGHGERRWSPCPQIHQAPIAASIPEQSVRVSRKSCRTRHPGILSGVMYHWIFHPEGCRPRNEISSDALALDRNPIRFSCQGFLLHDILDLCDLRRWYRNAVWWPAVREQRNVYNWMPMSI